MRPNSEDAKRQYAQLQKETNHRGYQSESKTKHIE